MLPRPCPPTRSKAPPKKILLMGRAPGGSTAIALTTGNKTKKPPTWGSQEVRLAVDTSSAARRLRETPPIEWNHPPMYKIPEPASRAMLSTVLSIRGGVQDVTAPETS